MNAGAAGALPLTVLPPALVLFYVVQWVARGLLDVPVLSTAGDAFLHVLPRSIFFGTLALMTPLLALLAAADRRPRPAPIGR